MFNIINIKNHLYNLFLLKLNNNYILINSFVKTYLDLITYNNKNLICKKF